MCLDQGKRDVLGLVERVLGRGGGFDRDWLTERAILASRNEEVDELIRSVGSQFPTAEQEFVALSSDEAETDGDKLGAGSVPVEFSNTLNPSGLPPHKLVLKKGMPIMLLCRLNGSKAQTNGTRLAWWGFTRRVIDAEIATGSEQHVGHRVFVPRITFSPPDDGMQMPFRLKRRQFPVRPAFATTINKA